MNNIPQSIFWKNQDNVYLGCNQSFDECLKYLHLGMISAIQRKFLPEIRLVVGISSPQSLHHFLANSPGSVSQS